VLDNDDNTTDAGSTGSPDSAPSPDTPGAESATPVKKATAKKASAAKAPAKKTAAKRATAKKATAQPADAAEVPTAEGEGPPPEKPKKKAAARKKAASPAATTPDVTPDVTTGAAAGSADDSGDSAPPAPMVLFQAPEKKTAPARKKAAAKKSAAPGAGAAEVDSGDKAEKSDAPPALDADSQKGTGGKSAGGKKKSGKKKSDGKDGKDGRGGGDKAAAVEAPEPAAAEADAPATDGGSEDEDAGGSGDSEAGARRRRRRGGRRRRKPSDGSGPEAEDSDQDDTDEDEPGDAEARGSGDSGGDSEGGSGSRRRRRRRRSDDGNGSQDDSGGGGGSRQRKPRNPEDEITSIGGSTRLEAKKQRRREGREAGRRRAPIVSEAEFLARRESVDRVMAIRQRDDLTQIAVLEDKVLVEHYVARESQTSLIGNVYLGRVQNVLPSMEAAFIDIGKGRNAVLYAGEVNWQAVGHQEGQPRKIESVLSSGQTVLVQVTKDPVGHKGARLTGQISLPGRFLVYVPGGNTSGISRKLPDTERNRLKTLLKEIVPDTAGVIVRTAAEGASEDELTLDVERLTARWSDIEEKVKGGKSPQLLYGEPDLTLKVVRDLFTEDFGRLVVQGDDAWDLVEGYVSHVAPDLQERLERFDAPEGEESEDTDRSSRKRDLFRELRIDEQIAKGLDRKVWLPSGGSLIIDRTEAMTVVDVNTGKFTGSGGNLEETVTKNNLEAAEEMVRQLRLRDIGGIIVIDFIDMVLESNRDLVLRRLVECLGRDRTRHQVAEVTSLGLVQMTRKRIGTGLLEAFSSDCEHCKGRGIVIHEHPVESGGRSEDDEPRGRRGRGGGGGGRNRPRGGNGSGNGGNEGGNGGGKPSPADLARSRPPEKPAESGAAPAAAPETPADTPAETPAEPAPEVPTAPVTPAEPVPDTPAEPSPDSSAEPVPDALGAQDGAPAEPPAPRVSTTTRRRTARRPAGPPASAAGDASAASTVSGVSDTMPRSGAGKAAPPSAEPVDVPVEPGVPGHTPEQQSQAGPEPDPRAAEELPPGPEADDAPWPADDEAPDDQDREGDQDPEGDEESSAASLLHVPIKRKGSRKR